MVMEYVYTFAEYAPILRACDFCMTTAEYHPRRKKLKGYQKVRK
jgi:hypothetical protein